LHVVQLAPRPGLLRGLLLVTLYAPLRGHDQQVLKAQFNAALLEMTHTLDMQVPTLLLGDFNGSACPPRDYCGVSGRGRPACALLAQLLGPGSPWVDVQVAMLEELEWTYRAVDSRGATSASRIDLVLANHAAMALVQSVRVVSSLCDNGHNPVVVALQLSGPRPVDWRPPRPRLPPLLTLTSKELASSADWAKLVAEWSAVPTVQAVLDAPVVQPLEMLSNAMVAALQLLVKMAGGWAVRPPQRRAAYDSKKMRVLPRRLTLLRELETALRRQPQAGLGSWPRLWMQLLERLEAVQVVLPRESVGCLSEAARGQAARSESVV
jgi:hypothetical protein